MKWWQKKERRDPGSNQGPLDLQSNALPTEPSRHSQCSPLLLENCSITQCIQYYSITLHAKSKLHVPLYYHHGKASLWKCSIIKFIFDKLCFVLRAHHKNAHTYHHLVLKNCCLFNFHHCNRYFSEGNYHPNSLYNKLMMIQCMYTVCLLYLFILFACFNFGLFILCNSQFVELCVHMSDESDIVISESGPQASIGDGVVLLYPIQLLQLSVEPLSLAQ